MAADRAEFSNSVALVTGGGSGIGAATARLLAAHGASVYAADLEWPELEVDSPPELPDREIRRVAGLRLDVRSESDWEDAVRSIAERGDRLDLLVHAAGISAASPLVDTSLADRRHVLQTNLDGTFLALKHGVAAMSDEGGAIVVIGSASGIRPSAGAAAYSTSKAAVSMLVRSAAKEMRANELPVRINVISPAGVRTPMWSSMPFFQDLVREHGSVDTAFAALEEEAGGRFAEPAEIAECVLFLLSEAAHQITGVELPVDGGYVL